VCPVRDDLYRRTHIDRRLGAAASFCALT
jgi:hypothetical protein